MKTTSLRGPRAWMGAAAVFATAALTTIAGGTPPAASYPGPNGKITFSADQGNKDQIYVMEPTGSNKTRISQTNRQNSDPFYFANGNQIVFDTVPPSGTSQIFYMNQNGTLRTQVTTGTRSFVDPSISPDGSRIVASGYVKGWWNLFIMHSDGTHIERFTHSQTNDLNPSYSPSGLTIVFDRVKKNGNSNVIVKNADGTGFNQLTNGDGFGGSWAPGGGEIVYQKIVGNKGLTWRIWKMNPDGTAKVAVTSNDRGTLYGMPVFSPDGTKFAFIRFSTNRHLPDIFTINYDGTNQQRLTDNNFDVQDIDWGRTPV